MFASFVRIKKNIWWENYLKKNSCLREKCAGILHIFAHFCPKPWLENHLMAKSSTKHGTHGENTVLPSLIHHTCNLLAPMRWWSPVEEPHKTLWSHLVLGLWCYVFGALLPRVLQQPHRAGVHVNSCLGVMTHCCCCTVSVNTFRIHCIGWSAVRYTGPVLEGLRSGRLYTQQDGFSIQKLC